MAFNKSKRIKMESLIYDVFSALDPTNANTDKYKAMFKKMSDAEFENFFKRLFKDEDSYLILEVVDYERDVTIEGIEKAAKILGVPLFEKIAMPSLNGDKNNPIVTKQPAPVGYLHIKRMQQVLSKKNSMSTDADERSALTGQVIGHDKNARGSDVENFSLVTLGADNALREFLGPRADDPVMKAQMMSEISKKGYVSLAELTSDVKNKTTLNTVDVFMTSMGIKTDLVTKGLALNKTLSED